MDDFTASEVSVRFGNYQIQGRLEAAFLDGTVIDGIDTKPHSDVRQAWRFIHPDTEFVINRHGLVSLTKLDGKDINLYMKRTYKDGLEYIQVQLTQASASDVKPDTADVLNYIVLICTDWQQQWDKYSQDCQANGIEPAHQIQVQLDKQQPVAIRQWLPYLHMLFTLQRI